MFNLRLLADKAIAMTIKPRTRVFRIMCQPIAQRGLAIDYFTMGRVADAGAFDFTDSPGEPQTVNYFDAVKHAMQKCLDAGIDRVLFLEDDIFVHRHFDDVMTRAYTQLENVTWDMLYLGGNRLSALIHPYGPNIFQARNVRGFFAVVVTTRAMRLITQVQSERKVGIDGLIAKTVQPSLRVYTVYPNVIDQLPGWSYAEATNSDTRTWAYHIGETIKHVPLW